MATGQMDPGGDRNCRNRVGCNDRDSAVAAAWIALNPAGATAVDHAGLPDLPRFQAREGTTLAYRVYPAADAGSGKIAILMHGSAGHSANMNEIAKQVAAENYLVASPDIRGHGASGTRGDIGYERGLRQAIFIIPLLRAAARPIIEQKPATITAPRFFVGLDFAHLP